MKYSLHWFLCCASLLGFWACSSDAPEAKKSEHGRWVVVAASRAGKSTTTLNAAYFEFDTTSHQLETNFSGEQLTLNYRRIEDVIETSGSALLSSLNISTLSDSSMVLQSEIRATEFIFELAPE